MPKTILCAVLAFCILGVQAAPVGLGVRSLIRVTDLTNGSGGASGLVIVCRPFPPDGVVLVYTHSMFGGDVRETFVPSGGMLRRVEMSTANAAAADYYAYTANVTRVEDRFRIDVPPAEYADIRVRVDDVGQHRLIVGNESVDLLAVAGQAHQVRLDIVTSTWVSRLGGGEAGC